MIECFYTPKVLVEFGFQLCKFFTLVKVPKNDCSV